MLKMFCICDRCKKQFKAKLAQRISFEYTLTPEKTVQSKIVEALAQAFPKMLRDYCPECVAEIKDFIKTKNEAEKEAAENEPE